LEASLKELLDLVIRWVHLIAGIMWVGNSMLFNWLDRNLEKREGADERHVGEIWMVHSGGFYQVEKKFLAPSQMPRVLHWFKWQSYTTWLSGMSLLVLVYYLGGGGFMVEASSKLTHVQAVGIGIGTLAVAFTAYDLLWRFVKNEAACVVVSFLLLIAFVYGLHQLFSGRAAYIHVGALMGTIMAGNVFFHIIPSQHVLVGATKSGKPQDESFSHRAKQRSIHNNYMTFPVLFIMLSNHFPSTYGNPLNYVVLAVIVVSGALIRHFMNVRFWFRQWLMGAAVTVLIGGGALFYLTSRASSASAPAPQIASGEPVQFVAIQMVIKDRCITCHSSSPTDDTWKVAPVNVMFDTPAQVKQYSERIKQRVVVSKTMPLANKTHMTQDERDLFARWIMQGAKVEP
jgi:uncharacterized membrane protein